MNGQKGAAEGTAIGAGIGAIFGGVGAGPGAAIGGIAGQGLSGLFGKKNKPAPPPPWYKRYEGLLIVGGLGFVGVVIYFAVRKR